MSKKNITLVTALYDIGRGDLPSGFNRKFEQYLECFSRMLTVDYPMIIYVPAELNEFVWKYRSKENTSIINKSVDDIRNSYFPFYNQVQQIRTKPEWINQSGWLVDSTQARLDMYNPLVMSKQFFLNDATFYNSHNTKYFLWVDAGLSNTIGNPTHYFDADFEQKIIPYLNKMMYVAFPYDSSTTEVHGFTRQKMTDYAGMVTEYVCRGGIFGGNKDSINEINDIYYQLLSSSLNEGVMGTEESIFTIIAHKYPNKVNVKMIESNGLVFKFLEDLKREEVPVLKIEPLALYFLVFNTPQQFEYTLNTWKTAYPNEVKECKKYVINNSNDPTVDAEYKRIFAENNMEEFKFDNIGICSGRQWIAEHFAKTEHDYYIFIEEDMGVYQSEGALCKNGFQTFHKGLFEKAVEIVREEKLDFLRLTFTEFFGDSMASWAYINFPQWAKDQYYPQKDGLVAGKEYAANLLNKPKIEYIGVYKGLPYVVGNYHYSNWPILFTKNGNQKVFLDTKWAHLYEQTWMSNVGMLWEDKKIKTGCLLASTILHNRIYHYDGKRRRENDQYTN